jgi:DNA repair exonuclease SbcCD ATPase subunit
MKTSLLCCLMVWLVSAPLADAAFYQWTDANGVQHFTDNRDNIPAKYKKKATKVDLQQEPAAVKVGEPGTPEPAQKPTATPAPQPQAQAPGGHEEKWWRDRLATLKDQLSAAQKKISEKQATLAELKRKRVLYHRAQDRVAINELEAGLAADQAQLDEVQKQMDALQNEAAKAYVPSDWLR